MITAEEVIRMQIAQMLVGRCNNCYRRLPGKLGCDVHSKGWNWISPNLGPFCDECFKEYLVAGINQPDELAKS